MKEMLAAAQAGNTEALDQLVRDNTGLIWSIVKRFTNRGTEAEDLFQIGAIGLVKAIKNFDFEFNVCFSTYAVPLITGEIKRFLRDDGPIKVSRIYKELYFKIRNITNEITTRTGCTPGVNEIAELLNVEVSDVIMALNSGVPPDSLYSTAPGDSSEEVYLMDKIANTSEGTIHVTDSATDQDYKMIDNKIAISNAMDSLEPFEKELISLRYFEGKTQCQTASILGVSQVQISRLEKKILLKMRKILV